MRADEVSQKPGKVRKGRLGSRKSRTGCITCKIRRIKCDESQPVCERCSSTGRRCDGYVSVPSHQSRSASASSSPDSSGMALSVSPGRAFQHSPSATSVELRAFDYYINRAAPSFAGAADVDLWCRVIPQVGHFEPVIWDAVIAIGSLLEFSEGTGTMKLTDGTNRPIESQFHTGVKWYSRAIKRLQQMIREGVDSAAIALLASVLFMCIETIQDNTQGTLVLVDQSAKLLEHLYESGSLESSPVAVAAAPIVKVLCNDSAVFGKPLKTSQYRSPLERETLKSTLDITTFRSLEEARAALHTLSPMIFAMYQDAKEYRNRLSGALDVLASVVAQQHEIRCRLQNWLSSWNRSPDLHATNGPSIDRKAASLLLKDHTSATILCETSLNEETTSFDAYDSLFESIVTHIGIALDVDPNSKGDDPVDPAFTFPFRFESNIIPNLCFVINRCRQPQIRRRALALLDHAPRKESLWTASLAKRVMQKFIAYEEGTLAIDEHRLIPVEQVSIPEEAKRAFDFDIVDDDWKTTKGFAPRKEEEPILMRMSRHAFAPDGMREVVYDYIYA